MKSLMLRVTTSNAVPPKTTASASTKAGNAPRESEHTRNTSTNSDNNNISNQNNSNNNDNNGDGAVVSATPLLSPNIVVSNLAIAVSSDVLADFFSYCGTVNMVMLYRYVLAVCTNTINNKGRIVFSCKGIYCCNAIFR